MRKCIIALVIGHRAGSPGAVHAATGVSEFEYNEDLAYSLEKDLVQAGFEVKVVHRKSYQALPSDINVLHPDVILSLHCNSFGTQQAHGTETLYYHTSKKGKALAGAVQKHIVKALGLRDRGIKSRQAEDRGGYLLRYTQAPCVIVEPGFLSNDYDFEILNERKAQYRQALVAAATEYARDFGLV